MISPTHLGSMGTLSFCFGFKQLYRFAILGLTLICPLVSGMAQDENATRSTAPVTRAKTRKPESRLRNTKKSQPPAPETTLIIRVNPADSTVYLDGQQLDTGDPATGLRLGGLKSGPHTLTVRHPPGYAERQQIINLKSGENEPVSITLERLIGKLTVVPNISDAIIKIESVDRDVDHTQLTYTDRVKDLELAPGVYDVSLSKSGYQAATRKITIKPSESSFLEPQLLPLPTSTATPAPVISIPIVPIRSKVESEGKYFIVHVEGSSGEAVKTVGSINVMLGVLGQNTVTGALSGRPCQVQFIQLENVAEGSLVEAPGPSNQWAKVVIRVRPKSSKRPLAFAINWTSLEDSSPLPSNLTQEILVEGVPIQKVRPNFPALARNSQMSGTVNVSVVIDTQGNVVSAKAIDGPSVFRSPAEDAARKWRFRPATRNGQPVESTQTIRFAFER